MNVLFPDVSNPKTGKGFFLNGLVGELKKLSVNIMFDRSQPHDMVFENIRLKNKTAKPVVVRFDGVYHDTGIDWRAKNQGMVEAARRATRIICQSQFGKRMVVAFLGADPDRIFIINNGSDPNQAVIMPDLTHKNNFIAVAVWRPHKRLRETIDAFLAADIRDSVLRIFGKMGKGMDDSIRRYAGDKVVFMDQVEDRARLLGYMRSATAMIHLCWFDCCPNSVIEAINQRCPVICSNEGGTHELVYPSNGIVVPVDGPYDYRPVDLYHPPPIDINKIAEACCRVVAARPEIVNDHVNIATIAQRYKNVFEGVTCNS
jgi:glycosyltransferase involved in cell wall biosynthesis